MYEQRRQLGSDETKWPHRIMGGRRVLGVEEAGDALRVKVCLSPPGELELDGPAREEEVLDADLIISATGYGRSAHVDMLKDAWPLLPEVADKSDEAKAFAARDRWHVETPGGSEGEASRTRSIEVGRDYGVRFSTGAVAPGSGVWLQGCCEGTHGVSFMPLSALLTLLYFERPPTLES
jgi:L-ornithine N5-oxygenase